MYPTLLLQIEYDPIRVDSYDISNKLRSMLLAMRKVKLGKIRLVGDIFFKFN